MLYYSADRRGSSPPPQPVMCCKPSKAYPQVSFVPRSFFVFCLVFFFYSISCHVLQAFEGIPAGPKQLKQILQKRDNIQKHLFVFASPLMHCSKMGLLCNQTKHIQYLETALCRAILLLRGMRIDIHFSLFAILSLSLQSNMMLRLEFISSASSSLRNHAPLNVCRKAFFLAHFYNSRSTSSIQLRATHSMQVIHTTIII